MNTWIIVCVYVSNDSLLYQLRLCVESILREVPHTNYAKLLVVDDHSPHDYSALREHYKNDDRIEFLVLGGPMPCFYGPTGRGGELKYPTSDGHGKALHKGVIHAKKQDAMYIWSLDSDTFILDGKCLSEASKVMGTHAVVRSVGEYESVTDSNGVCFKEHRLVGNEKQPKQNPREGRTNAICALWSLEDYGFEYHHSNRGIPESNDAQFENLGQAGSRLIDGLWSKDLGTAYFPFFSGQYVVHFGYGTMLFTRDQVDKRGLGNAPDTRARYGLRHAGDYYAGFLQLKCSTPDFHKHLRNLYQNRPFDDVSARFDVGLLVTPK